MYQLGDLKSTNNEGKYRSSDLFHTSNKEDKNTATESCISSAITITQQCQKHICQSWTGCAKRGHESCTGRGHDGCAGTFTESMRFLLDLPPMQTRQKVFSVLFCCRVQLIKIQTSLRKVNFLPFTEVHLTFLSFSRSLFALFIQILYSETINERSPFF